MAIPLLPLLSAAPGLISGAANPFGARRRRKEEEKASSGLSQLSDMFRGQLEGNYMDTGEAQGAMTGLRQNQADNNRAINSTAATTGMTDEAKIAMMGKNNEATAGGMSNLARSADLWRTRLQQMYGGSLSNLFSVGQQNRQNFNSSLSNILNPLSQGLGAGINAGAFDDDMIGQNWGKGKAPKKTQSMMDSDNLKGRTV
jgi:hypothetical protein